MNWNDIYQTNNHIDLLYENRNKIREINVKLPLKIEDLIRVHWDIDSQEIYEYYNSLFSFQSLKSFEYQYDEITVWRLIYSIKWKFSEIIRLDTLNNWRLFQNWNETFLIKENIIESWLWKKLLEEYIEGVTNKWIEIIHVTSISTALDFYRKVLLELLDERKIFNFWLRYQDFTIYTKNY